MPALKIFNPATSTPETLRTFYSSAILPDIRQWQTPGSLSVDATALGHWERYTRNPPLSQVTDADLVDLRDGLLLAGMRPPTVNKYWRELRAMFAWATEDGLMDRPPRIARNSKSKLVKTGPKIQRQTITVEEMRALYLACSQATYPDRPDRVQLWQVLLVMFWFYGPRTQDLVGLNWENIHPGDRLVRFIARKTGKLQGLPITDLVWDHLQKIQQDSGRVFPGFDSKGTRLKSGVVKPGFYLTWREEIQPAAGLSGIWFKHFRESMVTRANGLEPGLGAWLAGHHVPGVTAQHYDLPTERVRAAVERTPFPDVFHVIE